MKNKKILLVFLMLAMIIVVTIKPVYAAEYTVKLIPENQNYAAGQEATMKVRVKGTFGFQGKLVYDTNVFEDMETEQLPGGNLKGKGITALKENLNITYNANQGEHKGELVIYGEYAPENEEEFAQIKLKVKQGATLGKTEVKLINLIGYDSEYNEMDIPDAVATLNIGTANNGNGDIPSVVTTPTPSIIVTPTQTPGTTITTPTNTITNITTPKTTPTPSGNIPHTGLNDYIIPVIIGGTFIISLVAYVSYRRYKNF